MIILSQFLILDDVLRSWVGWIMAHCRGIGPPTGWLPTFLSQILKKYFGVTNVLGRFVIERW